METKACAADVIYKAEETRGFDRADWLELAYLSIDQALERRGDHQLRRIFDSLHQLIETED